ncbi:hypothetical protein [Bacillus safensis]
MAKQTEKSMTKKQAAALVALSKKIKLLRRQNKKELMQALFCCLHIL